MDLIHNYIREGGLVSHILFINILNAPTDEIEYKIRTEIYIAMNNVSYVKNIRGMDVDITWNNIYTFCGKTFDNYRYYHYNSTLWGDVAIHKHTQELLDEIMNKLDEKFDNIFTNGTTKISFLILKPATLQLALI